VCGVEVDEIDMLHGWLTYWIVELFTISLSVGPTGSYTTLKRKSSWQQKSGVPIR